MWVWERKRERKDLTTKNALLPLRKIPQHYITSATTKHRNSCTTRTTNIALSHYLCTGATRSFHAWLLVSITHLIPQVAPGVVFGATPAAKPGWRFALLPHPRRNQKDDKHALGAPDFNGNVFLKKVQIERLIQYVGGGYGVPFHLWVGVCLSCLLGNFPPRCLQFICSSAQICPCVCVYLCFFYSY